MLKQRIITAALLVPIVVGLLIYLSPWMFGLISGLIVLMGFMEWMALMKLQSLAARLLYLFVMVMLMLSLGLIPPNLGIPVVFSIFLIATIWWIIASILVVIYPRAADFWAQNKIVTSIMGVLIFLPCWAAMNFLRNSSSLGMYILLYVLVLIWGADISAYFVGRLWGKTKLAPSVSPGKTWEGVFGALGFTFVISLVMGLLAQPSFKIIFLGVSSSLVTVIFSIFGDLFESTMKRQAGCKDSGNLLPGHGGMYDRIDSLTAALPIYAFIWLTLYLYVSSNPT